MLDLGTTDPVATAALAQELAARGIDLVAAPAFGTPAQAKEGKLTLVVGGAEAAVARCRPVLDTLATRVLTAGAAEAAQAAGAIADFLRGARLLAAAEAIRLGQRYGFDPAAVISLGDELGGDVGETVERDLVTRNFKSGRQLGLIRRNIALAGRLAAATRYPLAVARGNACRLDRCRERDRLRRRSHRRHQVARGAAGPCARRGIGTKSPRTGRKPADRVNGRGGSAAMASKVGLIAAGMLVSATLAATAADDVAAFLAGDTKSCVACDLAGQNLREREFKRAKLDRVILRNADLSTASLFRSSLQRADLSGAKLVEADLNRIDAKWADFRGADMSKALLYEADLSSANLAGANLINARLGLARLNQANLEGAILAGTDMRGARLAGAKLAGANFRSAKLDGQKLRDMDLRGVDFTLSDMVEADFYGADLRGAKLAGVDLFGANFHGADLRGVTFEGANLKNAILTDAQTEGANFDAAIMPDGKRNE